MNTVVITAKVKINPNNKDSFTQSLRGFLLNKCVEINSLEFDTNFKLELGNLGIFWDDDKRRALISIIEKIEGGLYPFLSSSGIWYSNCIPFINKEQFKKFIAYE